MLQGNAMITESISTWLLTKVYSLAAAILGGLTLFIFWTPKRFAEKGKTLAAFMAGAVSGVAGTIFSPVVLYWLDFPLHSLDFIIAGSFFTGFVSVAILYVVALYIRKKSEDEDKLVKQIDKVLK